MLNPEPLIQHSALSIQHYFVSSAYCVASSRSSSPPLTLMAIIQDSCGLLLTVSGFSLERAVDLGDFAADRCIQLRYGLDRLNGAEDVALRQLAANLGQLEIHHIAKLFLRVIRDAHARVAAGELHPFVIFRVLEIGGIHTRVSRTHGPRSSVLGATYAVVA